MDPHAHATSVNLIIGFTNVLFFVVVQTLFWWFIGSREVERVALDKARILTVLRHQLEQSDLPVFRRMLDAAVLRSIEGEDPEAVSQAARERTRKNLWLVATWVDPTARRRDGRLTP